MFHWRWKSNTSLKCSAQMSQHWKQTKHGLMVSVAFKFDLIIIVSSEETICRPIIDVNMFRHVPCLVDNIRRQHPTMTFFFIRNVPYGDTSQTTCANHFIYLKYNFVDVEPWNHSVVENVRPVQQRKNYDYLEAIRLM